MGKGRWTSLAQFQFLEQKIAIYEQKRGELVRDRHALTDFYRETYNAFVEEFPSAVEDCGSEKTLMDRISVWFFNNTRLSTSTAKGKRETLKVSTPRRLTEYQGYQRLYWNRISEELDRVYASYLSSLEGGNAKARPKLSFQTTVAKKLYESEDSETKAEVERYCASRAEGIEYIPGEDDQRARNRAYAAAIQKLPRTLVKQAEALGKQTGFRFLMWGGGPDPRYDGALMSFVESFGLTKSGQTFKDFVGDEKFQEWTALLEGWIKESYDQDDIAACVLHEDDKKALEKEKRPILIEDSDEEEENKPVEKEGKKLECGDSHKSSTGTRLSQYEKDREERIVENRALLDSLLPLEMRNLDVEKPKPKPRPVGKRGQEENRTSQAEPQEKTMPSKPVSPSPSPPQNAAPPPLNPSVLVSSSNVAPPPSVNPSVPVSLPDLTPPLLANLSAPAPLPNPPPSIDPNPTAPVSSPDASTTVPSSDPLPLMETAKHQMEQNTERGADQINIGRLVADKGDQETGTGHSNSVANGVEVTTPTGAQASHSLSDKMDIDLDIDGLLALNIPSWLEAHSTWSNLCSASSDPTWRSLLVEFVRFEGKTPGNKKFPVAMRPSCIGTWVKFSKKDRIPPLSDSLPSELLIWWKALQPAWRISTCTSSSPFMFSRDAPAEEKWTELCKGGSAGIYSIVIAMSWYIRQSNDEPLRGDIKIIVNDLIWVLKQVYSSLSGTSLLSSKRPAVSSEVEEPPAKRVRIPRVRNS